MARLDFFCKVLPGEKNLHAEVLELLRRTKVFGAFFHAITSTPAS